ncbi:MAG: VOC family protein [Bacteroidota bacterium]|nr:VOC family protein [Bacteroidota bacterium]MDP4196290.1 VOC family protein [Bacteroidota bacterium]
MQKITPFLWFENQAEEAVNYYTSIFKDSKIIKTTRYDEASSRASGRPKDSVMTVAFQINGQDFVALNGGPEFKFTEAVSFAISCKTQQEVDYFWGKLAEGGEEGQCGWLKDKFGLSWQVVPTALEEMLNDKNTEKTKRVIEAMLQMKKLDLEVLKRAYVG